MFLLQQNISRWVGCCQVAWHDVFGSPLGLLGMPEHCGGSYRQRPGRCIQLWWCLKPCVPWCCWLACLLQLLCESQWRLWWLKNIGLWWLLCLTMFQAALLVISCVRSSRREGAIFAMSMPGKSWVFCMFLFGTAVRVVVRSLHLPPTGGSGLTDKWFDDFRVLHQPGYSGRHDFICSFSTGSYCIFVFLPFLHIQGPQRNIPSVKAGLEGFELYPVFTVVFTGKYRPGKNWGKHDLTIETISYINKRLNLTLKYINARHKDSRFMCC